MSRQKTVSRFFAAYNPTPAQDPMLGPEAESSELISLSIGSINTDSAVALQSNCGEMRPAIHLKASLGLSLM
jgi:hypothetical protein